MSRARPVQEGGHRGRLQTDSDLHCGRVIDARPTQAIQAHISGLDPGAGHQVTSNLPAS